MPAATMLLTLLVTGQSSFPVEVNRTLLVTEVAVEAGLDAAQAHLLGEVILTEFERSSPYDVIGGSDIIAMLNTEHHKQLLGCDDETCLVEIAGALDTDYMATSSIGLVDGEFLINVKVLDVRLGTVVGRASEQVPAGESALALAARRTVRLALGLSAEPETALSGRQLLSWTGVGVSAVMLGLGGAALLTRRSEADIRNDEYADFLAAYGVTREQNYREVEQAVERRNTATYVGWGLCAAGAVLGGLSLWGLLGAGEANAEATLVAGAGGAALSIGGRF